MLTEMQIKALQPRKSPYKVRDRASDPGFGIQVSPGGARAFFQAYTWKGKERFYPLGRYPDLSLKEARQSARDIRELVDKGVEPRQERERRIQVAEAAIEARKAEEAKRAALGTVNDLFGEYIAYLEREGKRSANQVRRILGAHIDPVIGDMKAREVRPNDIRRVLHPMVKKETLVMANRVRSYLMAAFRFGIEFENDARNYATTRRFAIEMNPARDVPKPQKRELPGERVLSESEVARLWPLVGERELITLPVGCTLRLILATGGQRVEEVLRASWQEFDLEGGLWEIPASRTKPGRPHVVPITPLAVGLIEEARRYSGDSDFLFPMRGDSSQPMQTNSLGNAVRRFCRRVGQNKQEGGQMVAKFTARDLRRTVKTLMGKIGISKDIRDRLQNHAMTDVSSKHYDRYDYLAEKRQVMAVWDDYLAGIIEGRAVGSNVIQLEKRK